MPAWLAMKAATIVAERRVPGPIAMQLGNSLVARDLESEHFPATREDGMGVMPWSLLAGGFLSGKMPTREYCKHRSDKWRKPVRQ